MSTRRPTTKRKAQGQAAARRPKTRSPFRGAVARPRSARAQVGRSLSRAGSIDHKSPSRRDRDRRRKRARRRISERGVPTGIAERAPRGGENEPSLRCSGHGEETEAARKSQQIACSRRSDAGGRHVAAWRPPPACHRNAAGGASSFATVAVLLFPRRRTSVARGFEQHCPREDRRRMVRAARHRRVEERW